jgi:hypothetical protein
MIASNLSSGVWNAIYDAIARGQRHREVTFGKVVRRDEAKKLVWLEEFGAMAIPLVYFGFTFEHFDTEPIGNVTSGQPVNTQKTLRRDVTKTNPHYQVQVMVPRVGQIVCVLNPAGTRRFPMCIGVIQGTDYWQGES